MILYCFAECAHGKRMVFGEKGWTHDIVAVRSRHVARMSVGSQWQFWTGTAKQHHHSVLKLSLFADPQLERALLLGRLEVGLQEFCNFHTARLRACGSLARLSGWTDHCTVGPKPWQ